ncbi:MAG: hypothetical protein H0X45_06450 [Planctomycetes bacterium]|nr:hypothetical protein [Planctomycetota bacterium]
MSASRRRSLALVALVMTSAMTGVGTEEVSGPPGAANGEHPGAVPNNTPQRQDPDTGEDSANTDATTTAIINDAAERMNTMRTQFGLPGGSEALIPKVLNANMLSLEEAEDAKELNPMWAWQRQTPALDVRLGVGTSSSAVDYPSAFPHRPQVYRFVTGGRNQLAGLNKTLKRASKWMNKHTCGGFNWTAQFKQAFRTDALLEYLESLPEGVAAALPMALIGAFSPQLAEIVKHLKLIAGFDVSATKADCHAIENALTTGMRKDTWATGYSECLDRYKSQKVQDAMRNCRADSASAVQDNEGRLMATNSSQASSGTWLAATVSVSGDKLAEIFARDDGTPAQTMQNAAAASAAGQGATGEGADATGTANAMGASANVQSMMDTSGHALESLGRTLFGSVRIHGNGSLEVGRKGIALFNLRMQSHSARMHEHLLSQLREHFALLRAYQYNPDLAVRDGLAASYRELKIWTFHARGGHADSKPWLKRTPSPIAGITDETMDACAYLIGLIDEYVDNPGMKSHLAMQYPIGEFVTALTRYEVLLYLEERFTEVHQQLVALSRGSKQAGAGDPKIAEAERQYDAAMCDLRDSLGHIERVVLDLLPRINAYRPAPPDHQLAPRSAGGAILAMPGLSFPAE